MGCAGLFRSQTHPDRVKILLSNNIEEQIPTQTFTQLLQKGRLTEVNLASRKIALSSEQAR
jgi:hypothetical protein